MSEVKANQVRTYPELRNPGDYLLSKNSQGQVIDLAFCCPCGCGVVSGIRIDTGNPRQPEPKWQWNGNENCPTVTPSIRKLNGCKWHGFLTDGVFWSC
jgi:hypothetical protein